MALPPNLRQSRICDRAEFLIDPWRKAAPPNDDDLDETKRAVRPLVVAVAAQAALRHARNRGEDHFMGLWDSVGSAGMRPCGSDRQADS